MSGEFDFGSLKKLLQEELSAVCFVRDYVEFHFDGPILRAISKPEARRSLGELEGLGWRDKLCALIGHRVSTVSINQNVLVLLFSNGGVLEIPILPQHPNHEALHFVPAGTGTMEIW